MPGPMGGGRGGGFSGGSRGGGFSGGSHGGGFSGGSRGGGGMHHGPMHHGPHHHHHHGPMFWGPRFHGPYHRGGIYLGGFAGVAFALIICAIMAILLIGILISDISAPSDPNGNIIYDERAFQAYANEQYDIAFGHTKDYESNILIIFTVYEGYDGYECIPWGGFNIDSTTDNLFGTRFESTVRNAVPKYYEFALTKTFKQVINNMTTVVPEGNSDGVDTSFSVLYNRTSLDIDFDIVNTALQEFAQKTGYNISIVVDYGENVFGVQEGDKLGAIIGIIFIVVFACIVIFSFKKSQSAKAASNDNNYDKNDPNAGQGKYDPNTGTWK